VAAGSEGRKAAAGLREAAAAARRAALTKRV